MHRMHHLYPDVMTVHLLRSMTRSLDRGHMQDVRHELSQRSQEVAQSINSMREAAAAAARSRGSGGAVRGSFGGGRSSGGGGGRW